MAGGTPPSKEEVGYWHAVVIGRYPSFERAMDSRKSDTYKDILYHRTAALEDNKLWVTEPVFISD